MLRRRLTALLASFMLAPSLTVGGGEGCIMGGLAPMSGQAVSGAQAVHEHEEHTGPSGHHEQAPSECVLVMGCGAAVTASAVVAIEESAHATSSVRTDVTLAPDSPALGLEPPPPRL